MPINLASSLSAITTDPSTGVTHIVWADRGNIWHASFDANAGAWVDAEPIGFTGTEPISSLSFVANEKLIDGRDPGFVVVWQQGKLNNSNLY